MTGNFMKASHVLHLWLLRSLRGSLSEFKLSTRFDEYFTTNVTCGAGNVQSYLALGYTSGCQAQSLHFFHCFFSSWSMKFVPVLMYARVFFYYFLTNLPMKNVYNFTVPRRETKRFPGTRGAGAPSTMFSGRLCITRVSVCRVLALASMRRLQWIDGGELWLGSLVP